MEPNSNFKDLLRCLNDAHARYLLVGAHAVAYHTEPRYTKDIDLWVEPTEENAARVWQALQDFDVPLVGVRPNDFTNPELVYQIGLEPNRIDILMGISGVRFDAAWKKRIRTSYGGITIYVLSKTDIIRSKKAAGRPQDLLDVTRLSKKNKRKRSPR